MPDHADYLWLGFSNSLVCVVLGGVSRAGFFAPFQALNRVCTKTARWKAYAPAQPRSCNL
jgi:hypothetical protein